MIRTLLILFSLFGNFIFCEEFAFRGKHFVASYLDCDREALSHIENLLSAMNQAVGASGATIMNQTHHIFSPDAITIVYLLSESHASIHTYPEHAACFVDLFTCGDTCSSEKFDAALRNYLQPKQVNAHLYLRNHETVELPCVE